MASSWSALQVELLETGANSGTWGTLTNVNLGDAVLGEAITGSATVDFAADADVTITLTNSATTQAARNLRLNITESGAGVGCVRNLILGSNCQIEKFYLINNTGTGAKTVKNTSGTGISVPAGKATLVYNDGTNVVDAASYFTSLTLGSALPIASGGTGSTSTTFANLTTNVTGTLPVANGGTGIATTTPYSVVFAGTTATGAFQAAAGPGTATHVLTSNGAGALPTFQAPATSGTVTAVSVASTNGFAGTSSGGATPAITLSTSITGVIKGNGTAISAATAGTDYVTPTGTETLTNKTINGSNNTLTNVSLTTAVTGTLPVANGGTNLSSGTSGGVLAYTASGTLASSGALAANNVVVGGGAGAAPFSTNILALAAAVTSGNHIQALGYADTVVALGNTGTSKNIDLTSGNVFTATLTGNCTFTVRFPVATGASSFTLILTNDATSGRTVAYSGGTFKLPGGSVTRTTTANATDIWFFFTPDGGTTYFGSIPMANLS